MARAASSCWRSTRTHRVCTRRSRSTAWSTGPPRTATRSRMWPIRTRPLRGSTARRAPSTASWSIATARSGTRAGSTTLDFPNGSRRMTSPTHSTMSWPTARSASRRRGHSGAASTTSDAVMAPSAVRSPLTAIPAGLAAAAWAVIVLAAATGRSSFLHHDALIVGGQPLWQGALLLGLGWQLMVAAMMLPASRPAIHVLGGAPGFERRPVGRIGGFLAGFAAVWALAGLLAFAGDALLHAVVRASPLVASHTFLIQATLLAVAGVYQFTPLKRRGLPACRPPLDRAAGRYRASMSSARFGIDHAIDCVASSWALMLLTFAAGFASLAWMAALTILMVYETVGRHGRRAASIAGIGLILLAVYVSA